MRLALLLLVVACGQGVDMGPPGSCAGVAPGTRACDSDGALWMCGDRAALCPFDGGQCTEQQNAVWLQLTLPHSPRCQLTP